MIEDTFVYKERHLSKNLCRLAETLSHTITANVKVLLLSNTLILIMVLYCDFSFKMAKIEIVCFDAFAGDKLIEWLRFLNGLY